MTDIIKVAEAPGKARAHVIFVHGLGGHPYLTWQRDPDPKSFWPYWLARDLPGISVWTLSYAAPKTNWVGSALAIQDRAVSVFERITNTEGLDEGSIIFVCHSLGGLVVKQLLRYANDRVAHSRDAETLLQQTVGVVFISTPHTGSSLATLADKLRLLVWPSHSTTDLIKNDPNLRNLNIWYRDWSGRPSNLIFFETERLGAALVVDAGSADASIFGVVPIPIERNHIDVSKPPNSGDLLYVRTLEFARDLLPKSRSVRKPKYFSLDKFSSSRSINYAPIIIRLLFICTITIIFYFGLYPFLFPEDPREHILNPIQDVDVRITWEMADDFPGGAPLVERLTEAGEQIREAVSSGIPSPTGTFVFHTSAEGVPMAFSVNPNSPLFPQKASEPVLNILVEETDAEVSCFANSKTLGTAITELTKSKERPSLGYFGKYGDYAFETSSDGENEENYSLDFEIDTKTVFISIGGHIEPRWIRRNGKIASMLDLENSECLFAPSDVVVPDLDKKWPDLTAARQKISSATIFFDASGRKYMGHRSRINSFVTQGGYRIFRFDIGTARLSE